MISLCFEEISVHYRNVDVFHQFCGIMSSIFPDMGGIMGHKLNQNGTSPSNTWLSKPPRIQHLKCRSTFT